MADKPRKPMNISPEERQRRSELAKQMHKERKFGGAQKGAGRPRKRAQTQVVEGIREDGDKILKALRKALNSKQEHTALKAALAMLEIENKEEDRIAKQEKDEYDKMAKDELLKLLGTRISELQGSGIDVQELIVGKARELPLKVENEENGRKDA